MELSFTARPASRCLHGRSDGLDETRFPSVEPHNGDSGCPCRQRTERRRNADSSAKPALSRADAGRPQSSSSFSPHSSGRAAAGACWRAADHAWRHPVSGRARRRAPDFATGDPGHTHNPATHRASDGACSCGCMARWSPGSTRAGSLGTSLWLSSQGRVRGRDQRCCAVRKPRLSRNAAQYPRCNAPPEACSCPWP